MDTELWTLKLRTGITVACRVQGDPGSQPVLLLHAWGESGGSFDRLMPGLSSFRAYAPDLRGQGDADKPQDGYSLAEQAEDAAAILDALGVDRAFVLGSSSGGYVAQQLAVDYPDLVAGLVLVGSPLSLRGRPPFADDVEGLTDPVREDWVRGSFSWFPRIHDVPEWFVTERVRDGTKMPSNAWKRILAGLCSAEAPTESGTIRAPALILWGAEDNALPRTEQEVLAGRMQDARLKVYPGVGHLVLWECPEQVSEDATEFFSLLPG